MATIKKGKWFQPLGAILLALLLVLVWYRLSPTGSLSSREISSAASRTPDQVYLGPPNSIAVLPFADAAGEKHQPYWPAGLSAELHALITRVPEFSVTSRNSSLFFTDPSTPAPLAAERLQVSRLLSGEVEVRDGHLRVSVQLYDARKRREAWSGTYEGELVEVFGIQDQILASIAEAANVARRQYLPRARPVDIAAWEWQLRGIHFLDQRTAEAYREAEAAFRTALEIYPGYEQARVGLARVLLAGKGDPASLEEARRLLEILIRDQPESPDALGLLSFLRHSRDWDWQGALEAAETAIGLRRGDRN